MTNFSEKTSFIIESFQKDRGETPTVSQDYSEIKAVLKEAVRYKIMNEQYDAIRAAIDPDINQIQPRRTRNVDPTDVSALLGSLKRGESVKSGPYKGLGRGALEDLLGMQQSENEETRKKAEKYGREREEHESVRKVREAGESEYFKVTKSGEVDPQKAAIAKEVGLAAATALIPGGAAVRALGAAGKAVQGVRGLTTVGKAAEKVANIGSKIGKIVGSAAPTATQPVGKALTTMTDPLVRKAKGKVATAITDLIKSRDPSSILKATRVIAGSKYAPAGAKVLGRRGLGALRSIPYGVGKVGAGLATRPVGTTLKTILPTAAAVGVGENIAGKIASGEDIEKSDFDPLNLVQTAYKVATGAASEGQQILKGLGIITGDIRPDILRPEEMLAGAKRSAEIQLGKLPASAKRYKVLARQDARDKMMKKIKTENEDLYWQLSDADLKQKNEYLDKYMNQYYPELWSKEFEGIDND